jgi:hypothetical protein
MSDLQPGIDDCLLRLPEEDRFGVGSITLVPGTHIGEPPLAVDVEVRFLEGPSRHVPIRSKTWVNGYFDGTDRPDWCRSLLYPPDILAITEPTIVVEQIAAHSLVRGVMCLLRHEQGRGAVS